MEEIIIRLVDMLSIILVIAYISGVIVVYGYFLRTGINTNASGYIGYSVIEKIVILLYIVFWPFVVCFFVVRNPEF